MQRSNHVIGKPVIAATSGARVGTVTDLLLDTDATQCLGVIVRKGVFRRERLVAFDDMQTLDGGAVVVRATGPMLGRRSREASSPRPLRSSTLRNRRVITESGRLIGRVKDVCVDERTGRIAGFVVAATDYAGLLERQAALQAPGEIAVTHDAIVLADGAARRLESPAGIPPTAARRVS